MPALTERRERDVIEGVFYGLSNSAIARRYTISERTVKDILQRLCERYGIVDRVNQRIVRGQARKVKLAVALFKDGRCPCAICTARPPAMRERQTTQQVRGVCSEPELREDVYVGYGSGSKTTVLDVPGAERGEGL